MLPRSLGVYRKVDMPDSKFAGITTNERLHAAGLLSTFDAYARRHHRDGMIAVLEKVGDQAAQIADAILANPKTYGF
jgi:hypothetical protein